MNFYNDFTMQGILIVENDTELKEMISAALVRRKFTVIEASNGKEAIAHFKPLVTDIVITNIIMPEEDGLGVIRKLKALKPKLKVIAMSGGGKASPRNYLSVAKVLGANATIAKPFQINDLISIVENLIGDKTI